MVDRKIDIEQLRVLHAKGLTGSAIARELGADKSNVSRQLRKLNLATVRDVVLESAHKVLSKTLSAVDQLYHINEVTNKILDELTGDDQIIDRMVKAVEGSLTYEGDPVKQKEHIRRVILQVNQDKNTALKACMEIRGQLGLQLEYLKAVTDMKEVAEFQKVVLDIIGEQKPKARNAIIKRLKDRAAIRQSISIY